MSVGFDSDTVNVAFAGSVLPSQADTSPIETDAAAAVSSSTMVPTPTSSARTTPGVRTPVRFTEKFSSPSMALSPVTLIDTTADVLPAPMLTVPDFVV